MTRIKNFFLYRYKDVTYFERRKASYLFYITLCALCFISVIGIGQYYFNPDRLYLSANLIAFIGVVSSLVLFRERKIEIAGHIIALSVMSMIVVETCLRDYFSTDPAIRYRLYISLVSLMAVCFIVISFFRDKKYILSYALAFELILLVHGLVIYHSLRNVPGMSLLVCQHLITVILGMTAIAAISTWLLSYMEALFQQNLEYSKHVEKQKDILEKMVAERTQDLQTSNQHLSEFAYIVSHDLKEPLRTISGFVSLIQKELIRMNLNNNEISEYIQYVTTGTTQMERLIKDILAYSKLNVVEKQFKPVDMIGVMQDVKSMLAKSIYESEASVFITALCPVQGQRLLIEQLFQNLISNAIKYRSPSRPLSITIGSKEEGGIVTYFVKDNGIGIAPQYFQSIFKAFRRLHSKLSYEGTGVGLAICKKITDIHGGQIWVESSEGEGSTFWFTLPVAQVAMFSKPQLNYQLA
jgi:signal transduction histidine kinase